MSPNPSDLSPALLRALVGALQALHFAVGQVERKAASHVWNNCGTAADLDKAVQCIVAAIDAFQTAVEKCQSSQPGGGNGSPPKCGQGFHLEFDVCVPDA